LNFQIKIFKIENCFKIQNSELKIFMNSQSNNPLYLLGTYLGVLAGLLLYFKGWHPFWWLPPLLGINLDNLALLDIFGGAIAGYTFHILFRVFEWGGGKEKSKKKK